MLKFITLGLLSVAAKDTDAKFDDMEAKNWQDGPWS